MLVGLPVFSVACLFDIGISHAESISDQIAGLKRQEQWVGSIQVKS